MFDAPKVLILNYDQLRAANACPESIVWAKPFIGLSAENFIKKLLAAKKYEWANWAMLRGLSTKDLVPYALYQINKISPTFLQLYPDQSPTSGSILDAANNFGIQEIPVKEPMIALWDYMGRSISELHVYGTSAVTAYSVRTMWALAWALRATEPDFQSPETFLSALTKCTDWSVLTLSQGYKTGATYANAYIDLINHGLALFNADTGGV